MVKDKEKTSYFYSLFFDGALIYAFTFDKFHFTVSNLKNVFLGDFSHEMNESHFTFSKYCGPT